MIQIETKIPGVLILEPRVFKDERGFFLESFNNQFPVPGPFIQDNHSRSIHKVLRGLHFQLPYQGKLVRVATGTVLDVAVDIRKNSPTFGHHVAVELSDQNHRQLWVPEGFAHGFVVLSESADFLYKVNKPYNPKHQYTIQYNDPELSIDWKIEDPILSPKDMVGMSMKDLISFSDSDFE